MNTQEARQLGNQIAGLLAAGEQVAAAAQLEPVLNQPMPFRLLDVIGSEIGAARPEIVDLFLQRIGACGTMGGWVVIGAALGRALASESPGALPQALGQCQHYLRTAAVWYGVDSLAERVPGQALVACFDQALVLLEPWREDPDRWVRRAVGVAAHFWAKRSRGRPLAAPQAGRLLEFLEPLFSERQVDAAKGVGWGLKTLGRYYPDQVAEWLEVQVLERERPHRALMLRKALTYLPAARRASLLERPG
jgi:hypothetical protein